MKTISETLERDYPWLPSCLSVNQKVLYLLLIESGVKEDALVGTMLLLKDNQELIDKMILFIWDNKPTPEQINNLLIQMMENLTND